MRTHASEALALGLLAATLTLAGCGGSTGPPASPPPEGYSRISISVQWPARLQAWRTILSTCQSIQVVVTGGGIDPPVTAVLNRPATTTAIDVPSGANRTVDAQGFDASNASGNQIQKAMPVAFSDLAGGQTYTATLYMLDMCDPDDDTYSRATPIASDGTPSALHVLHREPDAQGGWKDQSDWFEFTAVGGQSYSIQTQALAGSNSAAYYRLQVYDTDGTNLLAESPWTSDSAIEPCSLSWTAPANGDYYACVMGGQTNGSGQLQMEYRLSVGPSGTAEIGVVIE
jgi:hypothetical protein